VGDSVVGSVVVVCGGDVVGGDVVVVDVVDFCVVVSAIVVVVYSALGLVVVVEQPISSEPSLQSELPSQSQCFGKHSQPRTHLKLLLAHGAHVVAVILVGCSVGSFVLTVELVVFCPVEFDRGPAVVTSP
jgi:hypothetical protein